MKIKSILSNKLEFDNGTTLSISHESDDWEHYWADFIILNNYNINSKTGELISIYDIEFPENPNRLIKLVKDDGFCLKAKDNSAYFVPCYEQNNGYYNNNFSLQVTTKTGKSTFIDLTGQCSEQSEEDIQNKYNKLSFDEKLLICKWRDNNISYEEWQVLFSLISEEDAEEMMIHFDEMQDLYACYLYKKRLKENDEYEI